MVSLDDPSVRAALDDEEHLPRMTFGDHLDELRRRLLRAVIAVVAAVCLLVPFHDGVLTIIVGPYRILWRQGFEKHVATWEERDRAGEIPDKVRQDMLRFCRENRTALLDGTFPKELMFTVPQLSGYKVPYELVATGGLDDMWTFLMASFVFALVLSGPIVIWQAWAFIAAGLYQRERALFYRYFPFMMVLLAAGVLFGYYIAVPYALGFLIRMMSDGLVTSMLSVGNYFTFLFALTGAMGLVFQLPMVMVALQRVGLVRHETFVKQWRLGVMAILFVAMVLTPPDPVSMIVMAVPMLLLYCLGLVLTWRGRRHEQPAVAP